MIPNRALRYRPPIVTSRSALDGDAAALLFAAAYIATALLLYAALILVDPTDDDDQLQGRLVAPTAVIVA